MPEMLSQSLAVLPPEGALHKLIKQAVLSSREIEVVGLIMPGDRLVLLTNHSKSPQNGFEVSRREIFDVISGQPDLDRVIFWHSHPGGGIGPSRIDMQQKMPVFRHLVVSIVNDDLVYTFY